MALIMILHLMGANAPKWLSEWANPFKLVGFFIVSGYLMSLKAKPEPKDLTEAIWHKWRSIMVPYITFSILAVIVKVLYCTNTLSGATSYSNVLISQTALLRGYSTLWFLPVLFLAECFLLVALSAEALLPRGRTKILVATLHIAFVTTAMGLSLWLSPLSRPFIQVPTNSQLVANAILSWLRALPAFVCVAVGYFAYAPILSLSKRHMGICIAIVLSFISIGALTGHFINKIDWNNNVYGGNLPLFLLSGSLTSLGLMLAWNLVSKYLHMPCLTFIGINSLVLMATHLPLPMFEWTKLLSAKILTCIPPLSCFMSSRPAIEALWLFVIVMILELPLIIIFKYTPLRILIGKR